MALKQFKPTTPGRRGLVLVKREDLWTGKPEKALTHGLRKKGGRNNTGQITARRRGGGHKRRYRLIDFRSFGTECFGNFGYFLVRYLEESTGNSPKVHFLRRRYKGRLINTQQG